MSPEGDTIRPGPSRKFASPGGGEPRILKSLFHIGVDEEAFVTKIPCIRPCGRIEGCQGGPLFPRTPEGVSHSWARSANFPLMSCFPWLKSL